MPATHLTTRALTKCPPSPPMQRAPSCLTATCLWTPQRHDYSHIVNSLGASGTRRPQSLADKVVACTTLSLLPLLPCMMGKKRLRSGVHHAMTSHSLSRNSPLARRRPHLPRRLPARQRRLRKLPSLPERLRRQPRHPLLRRPRRRHLLHIRSKPRPLFGLLPVRWPHPLPHPRPCQLQQRRPRRRHHPRLDLCVHLRP